MENTELIELKKKIARLSKRHLKLGREIYDTQELLVNSCPHTKSYTEESYISGDYLNLEQYVTTTYCSMCHKDLGNRITYGSYG